MIRNLWSRRGEPVGREELARLLPSPGDPVLPADRRTLLEEHLMSEIDRETATGTAGILGEPERRPRRRLALLATPVAVAAIVAGGFAVVGQSAGGGDRPETGPQTRQDPPSAEEPLTLELAAQRIANAAAAQATEPPGPGQYVYVESKGFYTNEVYDMSTGELVQSEAESRSHRREFWMSPDGWEGMLVEHGGDLGCIRLGDRWDGLDVPAPDCDETPDPGQGNPDPEEPGYGSFDWLAQLPTDPDALLDWFYEETEGQGNNPEDGVFQAVTETIAEAVLPPELAAAMYEAAAAIPDVELVDEAVDAAGREGIAIARVERGERTELIFDADTYEYLGHRSVLVADRGELEAGTVMGSSAVLQRAVVDELGERPGE